MAQRETVPAAVNQIPGPEHQYRCACCEGIIEIGPSEVIPTGLDLRFNFIFDECELICSACTSRLIEANKTRMPARRR
jgi:hypothetical protein